MDDIYIPQAQLARLAHLVSPGKVVVVHGPRRVGKTTLIKRYIQEHDRRRPARDRGRFRGTGIP